MLTVFDRDLLANELKSFREKNDLKQTELAERLGLNRTTISFFENKQQSPSTEVLNKICELINKPIDVFFVRENKDPLLMMMGKMEVSDKETLLRVIDRIKIRKKYISLSNRLGD
ncbi:MAG TPA: helix-turn-helix transcriptional regulator [Pseudobacteroides sp.]|uniref:helix-turn-helix transcriptional regulator n=1 Tax=Pseudobacteroides sp. TaxID=1968840 RepID=UPI002F9379B4